MYECWFHFRSAHSSSSGISRTIVATSCMTSLGTRLAEISLDERTATEILDWERAGARNFGNECECSSFSANMWSLEG